MKTFTGREAPVGEPGFGEVTVVDLVAGLGRCRRFGGVGNPEWTVLHHTMLGAFIWVACGFPREELALWLVHDAHEAYLTDVPGPVKVRMRELARQHSVDGVPPVDALALLEAEVDERIQAALCLEAPSPAVRRRVKVVDQACCIIEGKLFGPPRCDCTVDVKPDMHEEVYRVLRAIAPAAASDLLLRATATAVAAQAVAEELEVNGAPPVAEELEQCAKIVQEARTLHAAEAKVTAGAIALRLKVKPHERFLQLVGHALREAGWGHVIEDAGPGKKLKQRVFQPPARPGGG